MNIISPSPHIAMAPSCLSTQEIEQVFAGADAFEWEATTISKATEKLKDARLGKRKGLIHNSKTLWLYEKLIQIMHTFNQHVVHQDWYGVLETIQLAEYTPGDHYDIHFDGFAETKRKLSLTVQLSRPDDYEGGLLQLGLPNNPVTGITEKGSAICFPSWMPHQVESVTKGARYSLVAWGHGPAVR